MTLSDLLNKLDAAGDELSTEAARMIRALNKDQRKAYRQWNLYEDALESIAANTCCEPCQEAKLVAKAALREVIE